MNHEHVRVEPDGKPRLVIPALIWLAVIIGAITGAVLLTGCAQTTFTGLCALKIMGQDEHGNVIARTYCEEKS